MKHKTVHEPKAKLMTAADVWDDAQQIAIVLRQSILKAEPSVRLRIPLSVFLSSVDDLTQDELIMLQRRVQERLTA